MTKDPKIIKNKKQKKKLMITLSEEVLTKLGDVSEHYAVPKSNIIGILISKYLEKEYSIAKEN